MESPAPPTTELRRCPSCRRDAPDTFFSEGKNACDCCAKGAPPLAEWIEAKLAERSARVECEGGADVASSYYTQHQQTSVHKRIVAQLSERDPVFAAEVEAKEMARAEAARVKTARIDENLAALRAEQESRRIRREAMPPPKELTPEEVALRERLRIRKEQYRVAAGRPAVEPPKPVIYVCPDCGSAITNGRDNIKVHRRSKKHLNALKDVTLTPPPRYSRGKGSPFSPSHIYPALLVSRFREYPT